MTAPPARTPDTGRPRRRLPPWALGLLAPVVSSVAVARLLPLAHPSWLQCLAVFAGVKFGADLLRGRAWPTRERYADDIAREWLAWALVAAAYLVALLAASLVHRSAGSPLSPALLAYWILWLP